MDQRLWAGFWAVLPKAGKWTQAERGRWLAALVAMLDFCIAVVPDESLITEADLPSIEDICGLWADEKETQGG